MSSQTTSTLGIIAASLLGAACSQSAHPAANGPETLPQPAEVSVLGAPAPASTLVVAGGDEEDNGHAPSAFGKYSDLITTVSVRADRDAYGEYNDYGRWGPGMWAGAMQPEGYWVYVFPTWYVWRHRAGEQDR